MTLNVEPQVPAQPAGGESVAIPRKPRVAWFPVAVLVAFWAATLAVTYVELAMFPRFISRMAAQLLLLLLFLGWWMTNRSVRWRDRSLAVGVVVLAWCGASLAADKTVNMFGVFLDGLPWVLTLGTVWLTAGRGLSPPAARIGFLTLTCLGFGYFSLVRWEGLDGRQRSIFNWRWTPSAEERFLATTAPRRGTPAEVPLKSNAGAWSMREGDWPAYRDKNRDGVVTNAALGDWNAHPPKLLWRKRVGPAWSSMIVIDGFLVTQEQRGESEAIVCYDAATGDQVWIHEDSGRFYEGLSGPGPRATPTFSAGRIYAMGAQGALNCLSAPDGRAVWSRQVLNETGGEVPMWGLSVSPLVVDDLVVVFAGGANGKGLVAYHAETGDPAWSCAAGKQSYSSPQLMTIGGVRQIVMHDNRALFAVDVDDGRLLWEQLGDAEYSVPMLQPQLAGESDLAVGWVNGAARFALDRRGDEWALTRRWTSNRLKPGFNDFFVHESHIYGLDDGILCCLDWETGRRLWKGGRYGFGQLLLIKDQHLLLVLSEQGDVVLVTANPAKHEELARFSAISGKTWNHPVIAHGRLYVRNSEEMACYQLAADASE